MRTYDFPLRQLLMTPLAARYLCVTPDTLWIWRRRGIGPSYIRYGTRTIRYDQGVLDAWLASHACAPGKTAGVGPASGENVLLRDMRVARTVSSFSIPTREAL